MDNEKLAQVLLNLDRCEHGRHHHDQCFDCPNRVSEGNPHMRPGTIIGYTVHAQPIVMPAREDKTDPAAWYKTHLLVDVTHGLVQRGDARVITWVCDRCNQTLAGNPNTCPHCHYTVFRPTYKE